MPGPPSRGWYVEVDASSGATHHPAVRTDPQRNPAANDLPSLAVPVPKNDKWESSGFEGATFRVWFDGARQPVDEVERTAVAPGGHVLIGRGGLDLLTRVQAEFSQKAIHTAASDLITNNTPYTANVDTPSTTTESNTTLDTFTSNADWLARARINDIDPVTVSGGTIHLSKTCFTQATNGDDTDNNGVSQDLSGQANYANGDRFRLQDDGDWVEWEFTTDYTIPGSDFDFVARGEATGGDPPAIARKLDINSSGSFVTVVENTIGGAGLAWRTASDFGTNVDPPDLPPGTHTVRIEATSTGTDEWAVDAVAPRDSGDRYGGFSYTDDNTTNASDELAGPGFRPDEFQLVFDLIPSPKAVTGIRAEATVDEGTSDYTHYVSNDQGANFTSGTGANLETDSLGTSFGPGVTYKAGLSRTGTGATGTPTEGRNGTDLQSLTVKADLSTMPIVVNQSFDGTLLSILQQLADQGDFVFAFERDGSTESVEWTQPGQRTSTKTASVATFESERITGRDEQFDTVAVFGSAQSVNGATFESDHGNAVALAKDRLHELKERVYDPDTGQVFTRNTDYTMDYSAGEITVLASGGMNDATQYAIDYTWQTFGEYDNGAASPVEGPPQEIPGLTSDRQCQQAARIIVDEVEHPRHEARVVVPADEAGWSVVDALSLADVPTFGESLHVKAVENTPAETVLTLGDRRSVSDVVGDIRGRVGRVSRKA